MMSAALRGRRQAELWRRLSEVNDPELDEPVTNMGFVERAEILDDACVDVEFRLPTYWCSPNFAFLMLDGVREAIEALSWKPAYRIRLQDHMFADEVNRGIAVGKSFGQVFGEMTGDLDLEALRETFRAKAYKRRQEAVLLGLRQAGVSDDVILAMDLAALDAAQPMGPEAAAQKPRYRQALLERHPQIGRGNGVFLTWEGIPLTAATLASYLGDLRSLRINMEFNGALCRGLKQTRYKQADFADGEPTLVDFILDRVPPAAREAPAVNS
ncbi:iron-sulfur cluster assembly protein [Labrys neptuniae]